MAVRRAAVALIVLLVTTGLVAVMLQVLAPGGWTIPKWVMLGAFACSAPWLGFCCANGVIGFVLLMRRGSQPEPVADGPVPPLAIAVTVRNEDMGIVLPGLRALLDDLDRVGAGEACTLFILSDTADGLQADVETRAVAAFRQSLGRPERIRYRWRLRNDGFKAGNLLEFMDTLAEGFDLVLVLDADSRMSAAAVLRLVRTIQAEPHLAIVQHLTVGLPAASAFPRLFQFGMRAGMRTWANAIAWWQGDDGCYWGHNAALRIAAFRQHCRLPLLPDGRPILSHDQVEAALLTGAGWGVRLLPVEDGSFEVNPPALPEFMRRELRWMTGNFEYRHLLRMPGLRAMGRWQLLQAILLFGSAPFHLLFLLAASWAAATDNVPEFPVGWALAATAGWLGTVYAPKLLGYAGVLAVPVERARYGGLWRALAGMLTETLFMLLLDPILIVSKTLATLRLTLGARPGWLPQNRSDRGVGWREAATLCWPQTLLGVAVFTAFGFAGWTSVVWAVPLAGGLVVSVPFCWLTAHPAFGAWLRDRSIAATPEEYNRMFL